MSSPINVRPIFLDLEVDGIKEEGKPLPNIRQFGAWDPSREQPFTAAVLVPRKPGEAEPRPNFNSRYPEPKQYPMQTIWEEFVKWAIEGLPQNSNIVIFAHNGYQHDQPILKDALQKCGQILNRNWKWFDTFWLARMLLPKGQPKGLQALREHFGIEFQGAHSAAVDAHVLAQVFFKMIGNADPQEVYQSALSEHPIKDAAAAIRTHKAAVLIFFDIESTGLIETDISGNEVYPRIVELAAYAPHSANPENRFQYLCNPEMKIPKKAIEVHHITNQMVADAPKVRPVLEVFQRFIDTHVPTGGVAILVAHNAWGFDKKVLEKEFDRAGLSKPNAIYFDTLALVKHLHAGHQHPPKGTYRLQTQRELYGIAEDEAHRAMGDVNVMEQWYQRLVGSIDTKKITRALLSANPVLQLGSLIREENPQGIICPPPEDKKGKKRTASEAFNGEGGIDKYFATAKSSSSSASMSFMMPTPAPKVRIEEREEDLMVFAPVKTPPREYKNLKKGPISQLERLIAKQNGEYDDL